MISHARYSVDQVAAILGISRKTAYLALADGDIPAKRWRGVWLIYRDEFDVWLDSLTNQKGQTS